MFVDNVTGVSSEAGGSDMRTVGSRASEELEEGKMKLGKETGEKRNLVSRDRVWEIGELDDGGQKVQISVIT